jgi:hypothetical protein
MLVMTFKSNPTTTTTKTMTLSYTIIHHSTYNRQRCICVLCHPVVVVVVVEAIAQDTKQL